MDDPRVIGLLVIAWLVCGLVGFLLYMLRQTAKKIWLNDEQRLIVLFVCFVTGPIALVVSVIATFVYAFAEIF
jgi:hypothetical protein